MAMILDMLFEFCDSLGGLLGSQSVNNALMAGDGLVPTRLFDAIPKFLEEDLKHFPESDHGRQATCLKKCPMEFQINFDTGLQIFSIS